MTYIVNLPFLASSNVTSALEPSAMKITIIFVLTLDTMLHFRHDNAVLIH